MWDTHEEVIAYATPAADPWVLVYVEDENDDPSREASVAIRAFEEWKQGRIEAGYVPEPAYLFGIDPTPSPPPAREAAPIDPLAS